MKLVVPFRRVFDSHNHKMMFVKKSVSHSHKVISFLFVKKVQKLEQGDCQKTKLLYKKQQFQKSYSNNIKNLTIIYINNVIHS